MVVGPSPDSHKLSASQKKTAKRLRQRNHFSKICRMIQQAYPGQHITHTTLIDVLLNWCGIEYNSNTYKIQHNQKTQIHINMTFRVDVQTTPTCCKSV